MTRPRTVLPDRGNDVKFSTNNYLSLNLEVTDVNSPQHGNFEKKLFGLGWEVSLKMPGDLIMKEFLWLNLILGHWFIALSMAKEIG